MLLAAGYALAKTRGLAAAALVSAIWGGGAGFLLNRSLEENSAKAREGWAAEGAINELGDICTGKKKNDARAKSFDPSASKHELVLFVTSPNNPGRAIAQGRQDVRIDQADILQCVTERTQTVETCTYDGLRTLRRVQIESEVRFFDIKSGEKLWETKVLGPMPRACEASESFVGQSATIQGGGANYRSVYDQHFGAR